MILNIPLQTKLKTEEPQLNFTRLLKKGLMYNLSMAEVSRLRSSRLWLLQRFVAVRQGGFPLSFVVIGWGDSDVTSSLAFLWEELSWALLSLSSCSTPVFSCAASSLFTVWSTVWKLPFFSSPPFPDSSSFFSNSKNFQSFSSFSVCPLRLSPKVPFYFAPFPFLFLSYSVWWKVLQCGARVPVVTMPTGCQAAARARSQGRETERQNERGRVKAFTGFTELLLSRRAQPQYLAPLLKGRPRTGTRASRIPSSCFA